MSPPRHSLNRRRRRRRRRSHPPPTMSAHIPPEIVHGNILTRLPVKSLLRFRCVCKPWLTLIDSPNFVNSHLARNTTTKSNTYVVTTSTVFRAYTLDCQSPDEKVAVDFNQFASDKNFASANVAGCVNGIVCVTSSDNSDVMLWNPSTRMKLVLPSQGNDVPSPECSNFGLGYDAVADDYKVVRLFQKWSLHTGTGIFDLLWDVRVFSLKSMVWARKEGFPFPLLSGKERLLFVRGALHWFLSPHASPTMEVKDNDANTHTEGYLLFNHPEYPSRVFYVSLFVMDGCLGLYCDYKKSFVDVWVMKEYGVNKSWTRLFSVYQCQMAMPQCYSINGKRILLEKNWSSLAWYDIEGRNVEESGVQGNPDFERPTFLYVESLVRLPNSSPVGLVSKKKGNKKAAKKRDDPLSKAFTGMLRDNGVGIRSVDSYFSQRKG